jgi:hypothetical protein
MLKKIAAAALVAASLQGCAGSGSHLVSLAASVTPVDAVAAGVVAYAVYSFAQIPSWSSRVSEVEPGLARIELERSMFAEGGDGAASMLFRLSAKKWCSEHGFKEFVTMEFVEFYEPRMLGAARKASGEARCA